MILFFSKSLSFHEIFTADDSLFFAKYHLATENGRPTFPEVLPVQF